MASGTDTGNPERAGGKGREPREPKLRWWLPGSKLGRLIIALNVLGMAVLVAGALILNELRRGLVEARIDSLTTQGELIVSVIDQAATIGEPEPAMEPTYAAEILKLLSNPRSQRARLFDSRGVLIADSYVVADRVEWRILPPARPREEAGGFTLPPIGSPPQEPSDKQARQALRAEVSRALRGEHVSGMRAGDGGDRVVSVSIPIQHVQAVLGVLTLEARDVDAIIARERRALIPFIVIAMLVTLASSFMLNRLVAHPVRRLARAADRVRLSRARAISLPDLAKRDDELGDLTRSLEDMTQALSERMDAIERFAADVAHEIRNPLTSMRSAVETLDLVRDDNARARLFGILKNDIQRLDRLVTDISNASRLDAELSRESPKPVDLRKLLHDVAFLYEATLKPGEVAVRFAAGEEPLMVSGREGPISQVFRNLIDNARSFSPAGGEVRVALRRVRGQAVAVVDDDGPGIPPENVETVFERFYTSRPKGAAFGGNSGLGLSIARQITEAHGGQIKAENRMAADGRVLGARFTVALPEARI
ncbi:MAG: stimulus-sensing domain-containing protein [Phenylobacterium sp.]